MKKAVVADNGVWTIVMGPGADGEDQITVQPVLLDGEHPHTNFNCQYRPYGSTVTSVIVTNLVQ